MDKFSTQRKIVAGGAAAGIVSTFLPWANAPIVGSISGTEGDGWITLLLFVVPLVLALRGDKLSFLTKRDSYIAAAAAAVAGLIGLFKIMDVQKAKDSLSSEGFGLFVSGSISVGFGLYLLVIAAVAVVVGALFVKDKLSAPVVTKPSKTDKL
jgi:hypothetical protein